jgi:hypothetical protein
MIINIMVKKNKQQVSLSQEAGQEDFPVKWFLML